MHLFQVRDRKLVKDGPYLCSLLKIGKQFLILETHSRHVGRTNKIFTFHEI